MSVADQIRRIKNAKAAIKTAIQNKGVTVSDEAKIDEYPALIDSITVSSGDEELSIWPYFFETRTKNGTNFSHAFRGMQVMNTDTEIVNKIENLDTSKVTDFSYTFGAFGYPSDSYTVKNLDLTKWDVRKSRYFDNMFANSIITEKIDISGWNFGIDSGYSPNLNYLFSSCSVKEIKMINCVFSTRTNTPSNMFASCSKLISVDLTGTDFSNITQLSYMFNGSSKLTTVIGEIDLSNLSSGFYNATYSDPLRNCSSLETLYLKNIYKNVTTMKNEAKWCINLGDTKLKDECTIYIINELPDLINDKGLTATDKIILTLPKTNTLTAEQVQVALDKGWTCANVATASATYGLRRRMFYKAVECEEGVYQASDGSRYEIFEANNVVTPDGVAEWDEFSSIEDASLAYGLTYIGEQED